ncbi:hypothetical protein V2W45_1473323 [Cenococcum geophilum]
MAYQSTHSDYLTRSIIALSNAPLSPINGKKSKFIQVINEKSRKALIDKKILDYEHVPLTQRLKWQMSLEEALKMTFSALRENYTYPLTQAIGALLRWHWDWDDMRWHLPLCFEVLFNLNVPIKLMRGWEGCRELTRQTTPAPGVDKEWEMIERFLVRV